jgi:hypothetical protein
MIFCFIAVNWIGRPKPAHTRSVVALPKIVETALGIAFFAGELVDVQRRHAK